LEDTTKRDFKRLDDITSDELSLYVLLIRLLDRNWYVMSFDIYEDAKAEYYRLIEIKIEVYWLWRLK